MIETAYTYDGSPFDIGSFDGPANVAYPGGLMGLHALYAFDVCPFDARTYDGTLRPPHRFRPTSPTGFQSAGRRLGADPNFSTGRRVSGSSGQG